MHRTLAWFEDITLENLNTESEEERVLAHKHSIDMVELSIPSVGWCDVVC